MSTIFDKNEKGKNKFRIDDYNYKSSDKIPDEYLNDELDLTDVNETEVVRHYTKLSTMNFGVDTGMYPLGSCTMKYNPKINERLSTLKGFVNHHPLIDEELSQGSLKILYELSNYLTKVTGIDNFSLAPAAGAHGELTAVMIMKKYFEDINEDRKVIIIPDSAHGTNPASVAMCGFEVVMAPSDAEGDVDLEKLSEILDKNVAGMMLTSPNTLGLFDKNILKVSKMLHDNGSLFYADGANLNALMGIAKMKDMGFDMMHINLHKTFSTPHGGGGPGAGPIGVVEKLAKYLPIPVVVKDGDKYKLNYDMPKSIGRVHSFYGNFLIAVRAYIYIRMLGAEGLKEVSETAVLNANYLLSKLRKEYNLPIDRTCMHEFVLNDEGFPNHVTTNEISKRILDYGFYAPTVYFPLNISGAIMIEPTETESLESLNNFVDTMIKIKKEATEDPEMLKNAPHTTPVKKVDVVTAAKMPVLKWERD